MVVAGIVLFRLFFLFFSSLHVAPMNGLTSLCLPGYTPLVRQDAPVASAVRKTTVLDVMRRLLQVEHKNSLTHMLTLTSCPLPAPPTLPTLNPPLSHPAQKCYGFCTS